jgi:outer membrane protein assembly factor BamB
LQAQGRPFFAPTRRKNLHADRTQPPHGYTCTRAAVKRRFSQPYILGVGPDVKMEEPAMRTRILVAVALLPCGFAAACRADDWPQFRGPHGVGISNEANLPTEWSADKNVAWKVKVPGYGWSSPIVWGDRVFLTTAVSDKQQPPVAGMGGPFAKGGGFGNGPKADFPPKSGKGFPPKGMGGFPGGFGGKPPDAVYRWELHCLDAKTGKTVWKRVAAEQKPKTPINPTNTYASETPVTDGERVYAYFGMTGVYCYALNGDLVWKKDLGSYPTFFGHGSGASPALDNNRLFIQCDNEQKSFLVALDKRSGDELWRVTRDERSTWSTPLVWNTKDRSVVVCLGQKVRGYDPANGKLLWEMGGLEGQHIASPIADSQYLYVGAGGIMSRRKPLVAIRASAADDITLRTGQTANDHVAWAIDKAGPGMSTPLLHDGYLYVLDQNQELLNCYDAKTGKSVYRERLASARGFTSSPWAYDGKVFCLDQQGRTFVVQAGSDFRVLGENDIQERCWSSPAIANGALFIRGVEHLYCIKK